VVDQVPDVPGLLVGAGPARADGASGAVTGPSVRPLPGGGRPPSGDRLPRDPEQVGDIDLGEAEFTPANGTKAERFEDFIGQLAGVG
jgi:hypothetical protein